MPKAINNMPKVIKTAFKKPGQKKNSPPKNDALRTFYSSLLKNNPKSKMAEKWMIEHGCLSTKKAETIVMVWEMEKINISNKKSKN